MRSPVDQDRATLPCPWQHDSNWKAAPSEWVSLSRRTRRDFSRKPASGCRPRGGPAAPDGPAANMCWRTQCRVSASKPTEILSLRGCRTAGHWTCSRATSNSSSRSTRPSLSSSTPAWWPWVKERSCFLERPALERRRWCRRSSRPARRTTRTNMRYSTLEAGSILMLAHSPSDSKTVRKSGSRSAAHWLQPAGEPLLWGLSS
jgi:hypothetical protein